MGRSDLDKDKRTRKKAGTAEKEDQAAKKGRSSGVKSEGAGGEAKAPVTVEEAVKKKPNRDRQKEKEEKKEGKGKKKARKALKKAVKKEVEVQSELIAKSLVKGMAEGNKFSAGLVMSFVEKKKDDGGKKKKDGPTAAELLGSEEQWGGESFEAMENKAELGMGGREPESGS